MSLLIICDILVVELFITPSFMPVIVGISILFILPVKTKDDPFICDKFVGIPVPSPDMPISWENAFGNEKNETLQFAADPIINSKIKAIVAGLPRSIFNLFLEFFTDHNKEVVADLSFRVTKYIRQ